MPVTVKVEAIHSGMTGNYNYYPRAELERAVESWVSPYNKPVLKHHNLNSEPIGRVVGANFRQSSLKRGSYCAELTLDILDPDAEQKVRDGRYSTVSVGTVVTSAVCSICKADWVKSICEHRKGQVYDGKLCYWVLRVGEHVEVSFVNHPADPYAQVTGFVGESAGAPAVAAGTGNITDESGTAGNATNESAQPEPPAIPDFSAELEEIRRRLADVESKLAEAVGGLGEAEEKLKVALAQNAELARALHEEMVSHYCNLALQAGLYGSREEAEKAADELSVRLLRGEILRLAASLAQAQRKVEVVSCPGGEGTVTEQPSGGTRSYTIKDLEEVLLKLLAR